MHQYRSEQFLPINRKKAWEFFSAPKNLTLITPPSMDFKILNKINIGEIFEGMKIDYTVKPILGIPIYWQTEICKVENQYYFTDRQLKGPYKIWEHTHTFSEVEGGILMQDVVNYKLPLGIFGKMLNSIFIKRIIKNIFDYRRNILNKLFI